jgi:hypothetical protein
MPSRGARIAILGLIITFLCVAALAGTRHRNGSPRPAGPAHGTITPSPYPHAWEVKR